MLVHDHTLVVATVRKSVNEISCDSLVKFMKDLVHGLAMQALFEPIAIRGKFGFTGIVGIVTSHIAFHYFDKDRTLHFDVYSCKEYDLEWLTGYLDSYWGFERASVIFVSRERDLAVTRYEWQGELVGPK